MAMPHLADNQDSRGVEGSKGTDRAAVRSAVDQSHWPSLVSTYRNTVVVAGLAESVVTGEVL
jgi:hypothetical protein